MKLPRHVLVTRPCRILKVFLCIGLVKLTLLGFLALNPEQDDQQRKSPGVNLPTIPVAIAASEENDPPAGRDNSATQDDFSVSKEMAQIREKKEKLAQKEKNLKSLEKEVNQKLERLKELQANLQKMLDEANVMKNKKIKHLVDVYSNMKPKQAAQVLETLNQDIAVKILAGMRGRTAGEILSYVQADKAAQLSEELTRLQVPFEK